MPTRYSGAPMVRGPDNWSQSAKEDDDTQNTEKSDATTRHSSRPLWTPFFLRRPVIVVFLLAFFAILCSLVALFVYSVRQHSSLGIKTPGPKYYYLWTYGPTAVFTILSAAWTQVEYRAAQLMPWVLMSRGPTPASESIFLDYLSNWNIESLFRSVKQKHYLVSLGIVGSLLLNAVTVFSTSLFELTAVSITQATNLTVTHEFNASSWNPIYNDGRPVAACLGFIKQNMSRPIGIHDPYVYPPFKSSNIDPTDNYTIAVDHKYLAELDIFEPTLECSPATVNWNPKQPIGAPTTLISEDGCSVTTYDTYSGIVAYVAGCGGQILTGYWGKAANVSWNVDWRLWVVFAQNKVEPDQTQKGRTRKEVKAIMCKPGYVLSRGSVATWRTSGQSAISTSIHPYNLTTNAISNVTGGKLIYAASRSLWIGSSGEDTYLYTSRYTIEQLWDSIDLFIAAVKDPWSCLMRMVAKDSLLVPGAHNIEGTEQVIEQRLFVRPLSFWSMAILMGLLITGTALLLCFYAPVSVCPRDTGSIGGLATVFARSPEFMSASQNFQSKSKSRTAISTLRQTRYISQTTNTGEFRILPCNDAASLSKTKSSETSELVWWRPLSSSLFIRFPLIAIPLGVIVALEVIYHISESSHGIKPVGNKSPYVHYVWAYLPAIIMFAIRCLFQSLEFGARVFQPYSLLRQGSAPSETSIFENQLRKVSIYAVYDTLRKRQWAMATASLSLLFGAVTPIVVSGLYTTSSSMLTSPCNLTQVTRWNLGDPSNSETSYWTRDTRDPWSAPIAGMVIQSNLSYPQWTYKNLAFPQFTIANIHDMPLRGVVQARLPALRARLNCRELKNSSCTWRDYLSPNELTVYRDIWDCDPTPECSNDVLSASCAPPDQENPAPRGYGFSSGLGYSYPWLPSYCSSHRMLWSNCYRDPRYNTSENHHVVDCNATMEEVDVDVRLQVSSFSFDPDFEPTVVKGSARPITTAKNLFIGFGNMFNFLIDVLPLGGQSPSDTGDSTMTQALIYGIHGVPAEELSDPSRLISRVNEVFGIVTAQALNSYGHESFEKPLNRSWVMSPMTSKEPVYEALFHYRRDYLVQNELSMRILEGLMGAMVLCAVVTLAFMRTKRVLPTNPCSIAGVASLLYGSRILGTEFIPTEAEWCDDDELKRRGVFEGRKFSMGWWTTSGKSLDESGFCAADTITKASSLARWSSNSDTEGDIEAHADAEQIARQGRRFGIDFDCNEDGQRLV
ncbi:hypothetical protein N7474_000022 [Penicillium riverlandense]|uniref:uncharacterized protein n=1 Tax=Penicillium riverlandense TaxID=1903569 RepID=UPI002547C3E2|nr:uncharacterized protein N7474_000022 [Penicillium riverlandense]KAJ5831711.1 hypothetical protein N7474_000022 [Penicillium riverlandense]